MRSHRRGAFVCCHHGVHESRKRCSYAAVQGQMPLSQLRRGEDVQRHTSVREPLLSCKSHPVLHIIHDVLM